MSVQQGLLTVWINAFIPGAVPGYTRTVRAGPHAGKTAVPLPWQGRIFNRDASSDQGYLGDQRTFSPAINASVRMQTAVDFLLKPHAIMVIPRGTRTSGTTGVDITTGVVTGTGNANMRSCRTTTTYQGPGDEDILGGRLVAAGEDAVLFEFDSAASDPLVRRAANICYNGQIQVIRRVGHPGAPGQKPMYMELHLGCSIADFPAFEAYASWNGLTQKLFTIAPPKGHTVVSLIYGAGNRVARSLVFT